MLVFPSYTEPRLSDLALAILIGAVGGLIGLAYGAALLKTRLATQGLRCRPWLAALAGGGATALAALATPFLLFSGQSQVPDLIEQAATLGVLLLVLIGIAKLALSGWALSTAYFGGPLFPLVFAGTAFGLAVNQLVPGVPQGVAVLGMAAGMAVAASAAPLSITLFLSLIAEPSLAPVIAIAAVAAFIVRQAIAPTLPGVYRATRAKEERASAPAGTSIAE
jgi:H+/Cl- antiporter ClcA